MQTFLPYKSFRESVACLDRSRLGKQRVEACQILKVLAGEGKRTKNGLLGWQNHPAAKMWRGYEHALFAYIATSVTEWRRRGYKDTRLAEALRLMTYFKDSPVRYPDWLGREDLHMSHRQNLVRKNPEHFIPLFGNIQPRTGYIWPTNG